MSSSKNLEYKKTSFLNKTNSAFIEEMYVRFLNQDPNLADSWKDYFEGIQDEVDVILNDINGPSWKPEGERINSNNIEKIIGHYQVEASKECPSSDVPEWLEKNGVV